MAAGRKLRVRPQPVLSTGLCSFVKRRRLKSSIFSADHRSPETHSPVFLRRVYFLRRNQSHLSQELSSGHLFSWKGRIFVGPSSVHHLILRPQEILISLMSKTSKISERFQRRLKQDLHDVEITIQKHKAAEIELLQKRRRISRALLLHQKGSRIQIISSKF